METREDSPLEVRRGPGVEVVRVVTTPSEPTVEVVPARQRRALAVVLLAASALAVLVTLGLVWAAGQDDVVARAPGTAVAGPSQPAALSVQVDAPAVVVAGEPAVFVLRWQDGMGTFAGTMEDWGDGVGAGSVKVGRCAPSSPAATEAAGTVRLSHTWETAGTYTVVLGATTSTCSGASQAMEDASSTLTVQVAAR